MLRPADVDGRGALRIVLGAVDVGPGGRMQNEVRCKPVGRRSGNIPLVLVERDDLVVREGLDERPPELPAGAGD